MTRDEAVTVLRLLTRPYNVEMDQVLVDVWFNAALAKIEASQAKAVAMQLIASQTYMPKPAQFIEVHRSHHVAQRQALPAPEREEPSSYGAHYVAAMREDMARIGKGGTTERKHTAERWDQCHECRAREEHIRAHMRAPQTTTETW